MQVDRMKPTLLPRFSATGQCDYTLFKNARRLETWELPKSDGTLFHLSFSEAPKSLHMSLYRMGTKYPQAEITGPGYQADGRFDPSPALKTYLREGQISLKLLEADIDALPNGTTWTITFLNHQNRPQGDYLVVTKRSQEEYHIAQMRP